MLSLALSRGGLALLCLSIAVLVFVAVHQPSHAATRAQRAFETRLAPAVAPTPPAHPPLPTKRVAIEDEGVLLAQAYAPLMSSAALAAAAISPQPAPLVLMLHGMCGTPRGSCDFWSAAARDGSWLLCPAGNVSCGDNFDWKGSAETKARHLDHVVHRLRSQYGAHVSEQGSDVLIGFSRGAFVARDIAYARPGRYRGLILIGAALKPDPVRLKRSGIRRVVLAAGDLDDARPTMQLAAALLNRAGLESRYMSTGRIYHQLPANLGEIMHEALAWVRQGDSS